ncbi:hypothetical protein ABAC460_13095 [Asticcacaulis sp. AC460]|uniref:nucleotide-binding domain-containing protein n=1 Tax=Asticcacaulis sp. AC460 TaxID=1282360 RepID=UPI0003C4050E|nr:nucleotidyltransferase [Asticcacaulis sp. AC460]ESQ89227.1 hypothetical protein ABAC460_13095 [Asticcacaulis sp. AC460]
MSTADNFKTFLDNIRIDNKEIISGRYGEITCALNRTYRDTESKTANSLQVGSYGRKTAIKGVSDLDMLYILPEAVWEDYNVPKGQAKLLRHVKEAILYRYPTTNVVVDTPVVRVLYKDFHIEVLPVFRLEDGFLYPDTRSDGSWKTTKPEAELRAMREFDAEKNNNLRRLCKMGRAWKNKHGQAMGGLLLDTLAHNFLKSNTTYDTRSYSSYDEMCRDFFKYMADQPKQVRYAALGSNQWVKVRKSFQRKAKLAYDLSVEAIAAAGQANEGAKWRKIFGTPFPLTAKVQKSARAGTFRDTEEFIEDLFPVDIKYSISLECTVSQDGFREHLLRFMIGQGMLLRPRKSLNFYIDSCDVPGNYELYWKVLNRGDEAERLDIIRGQIVKDTGHREKNETTNFRGDHVVEIFVVQNGVVVAKDRIHVPITPVATAAAA